MAFDENGDWYDDDFEGGLAGEDPEEAPNMPVELIEDDFEKLVRQTKERDAGKTPANSAGEAWVMLMQGKTIGKKVNLYQEVLGYGPSGSSAAVPVNMFELAAPDRNALDLTITLHHPQNINLNGGNLPVALSQRSNIQTLSGELDSNFIEAGPGLLDANTPGLPCQFPGVGCPHNPIALLEWGIGGIQQKAEIDFMVGTTINIRASFVRLSAFLQIVDTTFSWLTSLSAFVGPYIGAQNSAQRSFDTRALLAAGGPGIPPATAGYSGAVPYMAKRFSVYEQNATPGATVSIPFAVTFDRGPGLNQVGRYIFNSVGTIPPAPQFWNAIDPADAHDIPIPNGAMFWNIYNISNPATANENLIRPIIVFDLSI